ncbi:MAG: hypothetical protein ABH872_04495, partial [Candidatus Omnitrophota bacterium]
MFILVNASGVYIGAGATVDAQGLILSTRDLNNQDFLDGNMVFKKLTDEQLDILLLNEGKLNIKEGGFGVLIAGAIENKGVISAKAAKV